MASHHLYDDMLHVKRWATVFRDTQSVRTWYLSLRSCVLILLPAQSWLVGFHVFWLPFGATGPSQTSAANTPSPACSCCPSGYHSAPVLRLMLDCGATRSSLLPWRARCASPLPGAGGGGPSGGQHLELCCELGPTLMMTRDASTTDLRMRTLNVQKGLPFCEGTKF